MKKWNLIMLCLVLICMGLGQYGAGAAQAEEKQIDKNARCPVCGMFVAKFPNWVSQISLSDGRIETFDGVKDLMAFYFSPQQFGAAEGLTVQEVLVKDYYKQDWIDGRQASYVLGSDVFGPMGHELIPFAGKPAAENFLKDHKGREILSFSDITPQQIETLRQGHKMMGHAQNHKQ